MATPSEDNLHVVTVVIPALNEEGNISRLVRETLEVVPDTVLAEIIVVDDGSTDATHDELTALAREEPRLRVIRHAARCGQSAALRTGIQAARSAVIATMDGDGQNDPRDITGLLAKLAPPHESGPALVGGHRVSRKASGWKRFGSRFANGVRARLLRDESPDTGCGIKVFWRDAFLSLPFFTSMHRFLPMLFRCYGLGTASHPVNDRPRMAGTSKYTNLGRLMISIYDLIGVVWLRRRTLVPQIEADSAARSPALGKGGSSDRLAIDANARDTSASQQSHGAQRERAVNE